MGANRVGRNRGRSVGAWVVTLRLEQEVEASIQIRLRRIEGQIASLQRMLEDGRDCAGIAQQLAAARAGLDRAATLSSPPAWNNACVRSWTASRRRPGCLASSRGCG